MGLACGTTNSKAKVTVKFSEQEVHRVRKNGKKCKEHRLLPTIMTSPGLSGCAPCHALSITHYTFESLILLLREAWEVELTELSC